MWGANGILGELEGEAPAEPRRKLDFHFRLAASLALQKSRQNGS
jgi:hypothetical protein